jgi:AraC-like DNA-binding protein
MKPQYERVTFAKGCSLRVYHRRVPEIPFEWHHHPEYELTLTLNSRGWRFVGDHIGQYQAPDLVLVPPDMPHTWASTATLRQTEPHTAIVIWFSKIWISQFTELCAEYSAIRKLLQRTSSGLAFDPATARQVSERTGDLLAQSPRSRLHATLDLLIELAEAPATPLSTTAVTISSASESEPAQLTRILNHLHKRFHEPIRIETLCAIGGTSARSLHRLFVKHTGENVSDYLCKLRIGRACMRLAETDHPVSLIAYEVGLSNLANFNRQFRRVRQMTPTAYREYFHRNGLLPDVSGRDDLLLRPNSLGRQNKARSFSNSPPQL